MRAARVRAVTDSLHADRIAILVPLTVGLSAFAAAIVAVAISFALAAHLVEIGVWVLLFMICGEFLEFATAFDYSAVDDPGLRQRGDEPVVAIAGTAGSGQWNAHVRCLDGDALCSHSSIASRQTFGSQRLRAGGCLQIAGAHVKEKLRNMQIDCQNYAYEYGVDTPEIDQWTWP